MHGMQFFKLELHASKIPAKFEQDSPSGLGGDVVKIIVDDGHSSILIAHHAGLEINFFFYLQNIASSFNTNSQNQKQSRKFCKKHKKSLDINLVLLNKIKST